jgi:hypothetical protein
LENFEVGNELIIELGFPVDFLHGDPLTESKVKELTEYRTTSKILNGLDIDVQALIDPPDDILSWHEVGLIHESDRSSVVVHVLCIFGC